ncbi:DUF2513 domain-containing protein [Pseudoramibacter porci]|uniref:DUF2513 domain-containing protein n=1 Tax=Pseudoramibacter porci TaxID=2606631 RepID=A0A7X2T8T8_9FIRM|nr:DUF2513 domain-containing protein [Pseudoramibacter porci]MSS18834.1 DUF2513 domain-containing protein [Pseudoramibacter porci]
MKLNNDCVRDILLCIEGLSFGQTLEIPDLLNAYPQYSEDELTYTCLKLSEANLIECQIYTYINMSVPGISRIMDLTSEGHQFINKIRDKTVWAKIKSKLPEAVINSIPALIQAINSLAMK